MGRVAAGVCGARGLGHCPAGDGGAAGRQAVFSGVPAGAFFRQPHAHGGARGRVGRAGGRGCGAGAPAAPGHGAAARAGGLRRPAAVRALDAARELVQAHGRGQPAHDPVPARGRGARPAGGGGALPRV